MAYKRSGGDAFTGRSLSALARDQELFAHLETLVPDDVLRERMTTYLAYRLRRDFNAAMGDPTEVARVIADSGGLPSDVIPKVEQAVHECALEAHEPLGLDFVEGEAVHAKGELIRSWINELAAARALLKRSIFKTDDSLRPSTSEFSREQATRWTQSQREIRNALCSNVALGEADVEALMLRFAGNAIGVARSRSDRLQLPLDLELVTRGAHCEIHANA